MTAATMSGGNQQKVVIAKWLATDPKLLIIDEPTRGIDVGTKAEVHRLLSELAGQGLAILMISSELPEVLGMADRVLVVCEGRLTADIARDEATPENVMRAATQHPGGRAMSDTTDPPEEPHARRRASAAGRAEQPVPARRGRSTPCVRSREIVDPAGAGRSWSPRPRIKTPSFLFSANGWRDLLLTPSILLLLAVGQAVVIITRNVDLSVGSILGLTAYLTGRLFIDHPGIPIVAVVAGRRRWSARCSAWSTACWSRSARCRRW